MPQANNEWYKAGQRDFYRFYDPYPDQERREREAYGPQDFYHYYRVPLEGMYWRQYQRLHRRWYSKSGGIICSLREFLDFLRR